MIPQEKIEQAAKDKTPFIDEGEKQIFAYGFTAGVRFAEAEIDQSTIFDIDFCGHVLARIAISNGEPLIISALSGYGEALDPDQITITDVTHENEI